MDIAKGIAITLVVFYHAVMYLMEIGLAEEWRRFNDSLDTFRMPLFFFMSGVMATRIIKGPYVTLFRRRILRLLYLYVLWCTLQWLLFFALPPFTLDGRRPQLEELWNLFIVPNPNLWFIYALPLFFTFAWLTRRLPAWVQIGVALVVSAAFGAQLLGEMPVAWSKTGRYLFFFILAIHVAGPVMRHARRARLWHLAVLGVAYAGVALALFIGPVRKFPGALLLGGTIAVAAGIALSVVLSRVPWADILRRLGSKTLPIYLVHTFPMIVVNVLLLPVAAAVPGVVGVLLPPVMTVAAMAFALGVDRVLGRVPGILTFPIDSWVNPPRSGGPQGGRDQRVAELEPRVLEDGREDPAAAQ